MRIFWSGNDFIKRLGLVCGNEDFSEKIILPHGKHVLGGKEKQGDKGVDDLNRGLALGKLGKQYGTMDVWFGVSRSKKM